jgi:hypothetical protein
LNALIENWLGELIRLGELQVICTMLKVIERMITNYLNW